MKVVAFITNHEIIARIIHHIGITFTCQRPTQPTRHDELY
jgi:hypothetical protein